MEKSRRGCIVLQREAVPGVPVRKEDTLSLWLDLKLLPAVKSASCQKTFLQILWVCSLLRKEFDFQI